MKIFFEELIETSPFWPRILQYNAKVCGSLSYFDALPGDLTVQLKSWLATSKDSLRDFRTDVQPTFFWDFQEDCRKLALLSDQELVKLVLLTGTGLHSKELAKIITNMELKALREDLGSDLLAYAQFLGQYQVGQAYLLFNDLNRDLPLAQRCHLHGFEAIRLCSLEWPEELAGKFRWRLAKLFDELFKDKFPTNPSLGLAKKLPKPAFETLWRFVQRCLLSEVLPQWAPYFKK
ncbi:MAG: hypothetical protein IJT59_03515 [Desulfovibrionaceae bacterium]|nr:hypothetical protein [Desulfovibrionaceae bacterium]